MMGAMLCRAKVVATTTVCWHHVVVRMAKGPSVNYCGLARACQGSAKLHVVVSTFWLMAG